MYWLSIKHGLVPKLKGDQEEQGANKNLYESTSANETQNI